MKKLLQRIFGRTKEAVQNRFEAAFHGWGQRRWIFSAYQDARFEVNFGQSMEICRKHLDLVQNTPLVQRIRNLKIQFGVGVDGLMVIPNASDPSMDKTTLQAWNCSRAQSWEAWAKRPDLGSNMTLAELTIQWEGMLFDVGNVIIRKTKDAYGRPAIQTIDRLRLQTPPDCAALLSRYLLDEPAALVRDGGVINHGFDAELDELRNIQNHGDSFLLELE